MYENENMPMNENQPNFFATPTGKIVVTLVAAVIIWGIFSLTAAIGATTPALIICAVCGYFGWQALNRITPDLFLWMSIGAWIAYFVIKGVLAVIIGIFVAPFMIGKKISDIVAKNVT